MPVDTGHRKAQAYAYRRPQQYIYRYCQPGGCHLSHVTPGYAILLSACIFILPMFVQQVQLTTAYHMKPIPVNQWYVHPCHDHMTFSHAPLVLNNVLPAMVLQHSVARSNVKCPSSHSSIPYIFPMRPVLFGLGRIIVKMVVVLLLILLSGDVEMNPGPVGKCMWCKIE